MADDIDLANDLIANEVSRALNKFRKNSSQMKIGSKFCQECGDSIPEERQKLGFSLCVPCASEEERKRSLFVDS